MLALLFSGLAVAFRLEASQSLQTRVSLPLCGLAAVLASIWIAGIGPAIMATVLTTGWYIQDSFGGTQYQWIPAGLYLAEACALCYYGWQLRLATGRAAEGEGWQRHLIQTAGEGIWMVDPDGVVSFANLRMAEILGCTVKQIEGRKFDDFLFPEDLPAERIRFQNRRPGVRNQYDRRLRRTDGSEAWTLACSSPYAANGKDAGLLTMMTDITERKMAEYALRNSERKFRDLFENIREGVYQTSPDGRILAANPELLRMLGFSSYEELNVVGAVGATFVDAGLRQSLHERLERDGSYANVEFQLRARDGRIITVRENARVVRDENGTVLYYEGSLTDITEKIRLENHLRRAQEMEALGRLAGGIARDFRSIGGVMISRLQEAFSLLPPESEARPSLDAIAKSMQSAELLTDQILDFSERQAGVRKGIFGEGADFDVNALLVSIQPDMRRLVNGETQIVLSLCDGTTRVTADSAQLRQIVTDLVSHTLGTGAAGVIELKTEIVVSGSAGGKGSYVCLSVSNDGGRKSPWIGMATAKAILAQYGGTLVTELRGKESGGVRHSLHLPLAAEGSPGAAKSGNSGTVLLIEEDPLVRELSRDMLERQGFRILLAGSAAEAERITNGQAFDVLVMEWAVDGGSALSLVQRLRDKQPHLRVLFTTGYSGAHASPSIIPGGDALLAKPFSGETLGRKLRQLLER